MTFIRIYLGVIAVVAIAVLAVAAWYVVLAILNLLTELVLWTLSHS